MMKNKVIRAPAILQIAITRVAQASADQRDIEEFRNYLFSFLVFTINEKKMLDVAKNDSREHVLILLLIAATLVPCCIVNICQPRLMFSLISVYVNFQE